MQVGSLVEYIGGQDEEGKKGFELHRGIVYTIKIMKSELFKGGQKDAIGLEEADDWMFVKTMFREVQPPTEVNLEIILNGKDEEKHHEAQKGS